MLGIGIWAYRSTKMLSLYWRRMNWAGALAGVLVGGATIVVWKQLSGGLFEFYEMLPGVVFATLAIVVASGRRVGLRASARPTEVQRNVRASKPATLRARARGLRV